MKTLLRSALGIAALSATLIGCSATDETPARSGVVVRPRIVNFRLTPTEAGGLVKCSYLNAVDPRSMKPASFTASAAMAGATCRAFAAAIERDHPLPVKRDAAGKVMDDVIGCAATAEMPEQPACPWDDLSRAKVGFIEPEPAPATAP